MGNLLNLEMLLLGSNQLSGEVPPELGSLSSLQVLVLHSNQLSGELPPGLGNLANLETLDLRSNQLSGLRYVAALQYHLDSNRSNLGVLPFCG